MAKGVYAAIILLVLGLIIGCSTRSYNQQPFSGDISELNGNAVKDVVQDTTTTTLAENITEYKPAHRIYNVNITAYGFEPQTLDLDVGDSIVWLSVDQQKPTNNIQIFDSDNLGKRSVFYSGRLFYGDEFSHTYYSKGKYVVIDLSFSDESDRDQTMQTVFVH